MPWVTSGVVGCLADARTWRSDTLSRTASLMETLSVRVAWWGTTYVLVPPTSTPRRTTAMVVGGVKEFPEKERAVCCSIKSTTRTLLLRHPQNSDQRPS